MPEQTETEALAELAATAFEAEQLVPGEVYLVSDGDGRQRIVDTDAWAESPRHATAAREVYDAASFADYLARHGDEATEVYADPSRERVTAIIDSHDRGIPGWQGHRIDLVLTLSPAWQAWRRLDGQLLPQTDFAEHIELNAADVREPSAADLLDLAQTFEATKSVDYESSERLANGQTRLRYVETIEARAGQKGDVEIPAQIRLAIRPFIGGPPYAVTARFRYRITPDRSLKLGYVIERPQLIRDSAFEDVIALLRTGRDATDTERAVPAVRAPIFLGRPS